MAGKRLIRKRDGRRGPAWFMVLVVLVAVGLVGPQVAAKGDAQAHAQAPCKEVVVREGDTLWEIALAYKRPREDVRVTVNRIREANGLAPSEYIYPGQVLIIPLE